MKPLELNTKYNIDEILERRNTDFNKYIFSFDQDINWDNDDILSSKLNKYYESDDKDNFIKTFNEYYKKYQTEGLSFEVVRVIEMKGPGASWPYVTYSTKKLMTIDELIRTNNEEFFTDYAFELQVTKIEECDTQ